jgi:hypothetical protein
MKFKKEDLQEMVYEESEKLELVEDKVIENDRWAILHGVIFRDIESGKYYESSYRVGSTEMQEESPYEYADAEEECAEVEQKEVLVKQWVKIGE